MAVYMLCTNGRYPGGALPDVKGSVSQAAHPEWISLTSMTLPTDRGEVNTAPGNVTDRTTSQVDFTDIDIQKPMDKASPNLMAWNISGATYQVVIDICKEDGNSVMRIELSDVILTKYTSEADEEGAVTESLSLDYTKIEMQFQEYNKDNKPAGSPRVIGYDLETASGGLLG